MKSQIFKKVSLIVSVFALSLSFISSCYDSGDSGGKTGGGGVTPDYTNAGLPLAEKQDWLIMYYCDADNNLEEDLMNDLNEMESINLSGKKIKIVALVDRNTSYWTGDGNWSDSRVYEIKYDSGGYNKILVSTRIAIESLGISNNASNAEVNMGDGATLKAFIEFCNVNYPATHKMLLLSNHGGGWRDNPGMQKNMMEKTGVTRGVCWDETSSDDCLYTSELRTAIASALGSGNKLDIITFDACLMAMIEVAYELRDLSYYLVASQEIVPGCGFPYTQILNSLPAELGTYSSSDFSKNIIDNYYNAYINGTNVEDPDKDTTITLSLIDLSKIPALATSINSMGTALDAYYGNNPNIDIRLQSELFSNIDYVDIRDFCTKETQCKTERDNVITAFDAAVIYNRAGSGNGGARGLSIYMPIKWVNKWEQPDYSSTNIQFAAADAAPSWKTYISSITNPTATDSNEIREYENGGIIGVSVPSSGNRTETGYIYYNNDEDIYGITSDGTFRINYSGSANIIVDVYIIDSATGTPVNNPYMTSPGNLNISYNTSTQFVLVLIYGSTSISNSYTLTFSNI